MKNYTLFSLLLLSVGLNAQVNYTTLTKKALQTMWDAKDLSAYEKSLNMYEEAFKIYPDSIDALGLYKASVLASNLNQNDKAFKYLEPLTAIKMDNYGYPGYSYVLHKGAKKEYKNLLADPRWEALTQKANQDKVAFYEELQEKEKEFYSVTASALDKVKDPKTLYQKIKNFHPYKAKEEQGYSLSFKLSDTETSSFFVHLPETYDPNKKYPLLFILHGAVRRANLADYQVAEWRLGGWNRFYTKYAAENEVILVFPQGSRQYNWMTSDDGFHMIPDMLKRIKKGINIDDNRVYISGHSNGATGSFSYLMKQPTQFAGFYGLNTYPKVFTGGTFIENIRNRSFINFSTDQDYYYPPNANDDLTALMKEMEADYQEYRYNGYPHWFPKFDASEPAFQTLFEDLKVRNRNPFPSTINWEFDDENNGQVDWLSDIKLDTLSPKAEWHTATNFKINKWLNFRDNKSDELVEVDVDRNAFDFPRKSAKIVARYEDNIFHIEASSIKSFSIKLSPEMLDFSKELVVYVNGKKYFDSKVEYNKVFMLQNFENTRDRSQVWVNYISIEL